jgi:hypothetical protein
MVGSTNYNSPYKVFTPILHHNGGAHPALMINLHFKERRGSTIDGIIECSKTRIEKPEIECGAITDMLILTSQEVEPGPGALLMQPVYPSNGGTQVSVALTRVMWSHSYVLMMSNSFVLCLLADLVNWGACILHCLG